MPKIFNTTLKKNISYDETEEDVKDILQYVENMEVEDLKKMAIDARGLPTEVEIDYKTKFYCGIDKGMLYVSFEKK